MINKTYWKRIVSYTVRTYFAPITGAYKGIRSEYRSIDAEAAAGRDAQRPKPSGSAPRHGVELCCNAAEGCDREPERRALSKSSHIYAKAHV